MFVIIKAPFSCVNTNSTNQLVFTYQSITSSDINVSLSNCSLGFFNDFTKSIEVEEYARFSHSNITQNLLTTTSSLPIKSTCGDQCHICDPVTLQCHHCFNSTYSPYNFYSSADMKCYSTCPSGTFKNSSVCLSCHPICATCSGGSFDSC